MPKVAVSPLEEKRRIVRGYMAKNMELYGIKDEDLAKALNVTTRTIQNRKRRPENFTMKELWEMSKKLKLSPEEKAAII